MAKKSAQNKSVIKYLLFTVIVLLVTVSLLSLVVFKYTNLGSDSVLGAHVEPMPAALLCGACHGVIVLQKEGANPRSWGAKCVTQTDFHNLSNYLAYLVCPVPTVMPKPTSRPTPIISSHPERTSR